MSASSPTLAIYWYDGRSPRPHAGTLKRDGDTVIVEAAGQTRRHAVTHVRWPERTSRSSRQVDLPDGSLLAAVDIEAWDQWCDTVGLKETLLGRVMRNQSSAVVAAAITTAVVGAFWHWGIPLLSHQVAHALPATVEQKLGDYAMGQLDNLFLSESTHPQAQQTALRLQLTSLLADSRPHAPPWTLHVRHSKALGANAFALPGGHIVVTDGLLDMLHDQPDTLLGVLAHELGHVEHRHGIDIVVRASLTGALVGLLFGDASTLLTVVPLTLMTQAYSRNAEREADHYAAETLARSGRSPAVMAVLFERLQALTSQTSATQDKSEAPESRQLPIAISSHPDHAERITFFTTWSTRSDPPPDARE